MAVVVEYVWAEEAAAKALDDNDVAACGEEAASEQSALEEHMFERDARLLLFVLAVLEQHTLEFAGL